MSVKIYWCNLVGVLDVVVYFIVIFVIFGKWFLFEVEV